MQIIIDIDKEYYKAITEIPNHQCTADMLIIKNGTPLPKGHGRLIDADKVIEEATEMMKYPKNHTYMECIIAHMNLAPTIIDAESEGAE